MMKTTDFMQGTATMELFYLSSPGLNNKLNPSLHFQNLASIAGGETNQHCITGLAQLKRQLENNRSKLLYFLAHSDQNKGMYIGESVNINGQLFAKMLPKQKSRIPEIIIFNTCYGVQSGLAEAALAAGVKTVIATQQSISIKGMCDYTTQLLEVWIDGETSLRDSMDRTNTKYVNKGVEFGLYGSIPSKI
jgi:hypothetical protein